MEQDIYDASRNGDCEYIKTLVMSGAAPERAEDALGQTPLMFASSSNRIKVMSLLIGLGCSVNVVDKQGVNALGCAVKNGQLAATLLLLLFDGEYRGPDKIHSFTRKAEALHNFVTLVESARGLFR